MTRLSWVEEERDVLVAKGLTGHTYRIEPNDQNAGAFKVISNGRAVLGRGTQADCIRIANSFEPDPGPESGNRIRILDANPLSRRD